MAAGKHVAIHMCSIEQLVHGMLQAESLCHWFILGLFLHPYLGIPVVPTVTCRVGEGHGRPPLIHSIHPAFNSANRLSMHASPVLVALCLASLVLLTSSELVCKHPL